MTSLSFDLTQTENTEVQNDTSQWGRTILRTKTTLIKPHSRVKELKNIII
jgi:hypothetical protein